MSNFIRNIPLEHDISKQITLVQIDVCSPLRNYNYIVHNNKSGFTFAVDPTYSTPILKLLDDREWSLDAILTTHHHLDHVNGNNDIVKKTGCIVIGNEEDSHRIPAITHLCNPDNISTIFTEYKIEMIKLYGHTIGQVGYYLPSLKLLFAGDALFSMGCGRIAEGYMKKGYESLMKIMDLPDDVMLVCAHEYTADNARFAINLEPDNKALQHRITQVRKLRTNKEPTVPILLAVEKATNPFLRVHSKSIRENIGMIESTNLEVFIKIREMKNNL